MTLFTSLFARVRRSRPATVLAAGLVGLLLSVAGPPVLTALGGQSAPVGCHSTVVGDQSSPCANDPPTVDSNSGGDDSGPPDDVVAATPPFTG
jgi:hypothetical protein